ncbi:hypothetical protein Q31a_06920 [Aureliella helgolandensis]|uniref:Uncharacterized protein n=1 Tax=Aureliella helgolandensis TaxID=2527968 RepID=A0A518G1C9_9BACT|nr:hypothetical protein Q31a_06920 [Aureliella helgolandensis]
MEIPPPLANADQRTAVSPPTPTLVSKACKLLITHALKHNCYAVFAPSRVAVKVLSQNE